MRRGSGNKLSLCLHAAVVIAVALLAACGGSSSGPVPQPQSTSGTAVIYPQNPSVPVGGVINFLANQPGQFNATFAWSVSGGGSINSGTGVYTAGTSPGTATVTATSGNFKASTTVNVTAAPTGGITMTPAALVVQAGSTTQIGVPNGTNVTEWDVHGTPGGDTAYGTINSNGNYIAPLTPPPGGSVTITAKTASAVGNAVVTVVFSSASLKGPYAFSYTGADPKGLLNVVGSFTADGSGNISNFVEDLVASDVPPATSNPLSGTVKVAPDGTAQAMIGSGSTLTGSATWELELVGNAAADAGKPAQKALLVRFDALGTGSGTIEQQDASAANLPLPQGPYTFLVSQNGAIKNMFVAAGKFVSSGLLGNSGGLTPGVWDVNYNGGTVVSNDTTLSGSFALDTSRPGTGRGTLTLDTNNAIAGPHCTATSGSCLNFVFYVVDSTHLKLIESDGGILSSGDVFSAPNTDGLFTTASVTRGDYAFTSLGASNNGAYSQGGVFASNGAGSIVTGEMDINDAGSTKLLGALSQTSYTIDPSLGRIAFTLTDNVNDKSAGTWTYAGYQTANGDIAMVEVDSLNVVSVVAGTAYRQTSTSTLQNSYAANFTAPNSSREEDVAGQFVVSNTAIASGSLNSNLIGTATLAGAPITQALIVSPDSGGRGTATISTNAESFPIAYYVIDANRAVLMETDSTRVLTGTLVRQY